MAKGHYQSKSQRPRWILPLCGIVLIAVMVVAVIIAVKPKAAITPDGSTMQDANCVEKNDNTISIPGYEGISLVADTKQQTVGLPNPAQNTCYFQITLLLENGTELWQSKLIEPGKVSDPMKLVNALPKGTYPNAILQYDCYSMDGNMTALNGAETKLTLWVK